MRTAYLLIRDAPPYRADAFAQGLQAAGYRVAKGAVDQARAGDVLVTWNLYGDGANWARRLKPRGVPVLVAENGYLGADGEGRQLYALARDGHNGAGWWPYKNEKAPAQRWEALGLALQPWQTRKAPVLVCPQRGIGAPPARMPDDWARQALHALERARAPARLRPHPGRDAPVVPLADDLRQAAAVAVWSSKAGIEAILAGVPVFHGMPGWIGAAAATEGLPLPGAKPFTGDRLPMLRRLAWAQWTLAELASGLPFKLLLDGAQEKAA